jgi:hypothetical protein
VTLDQQQRLLALFRMVVTELRDAYWEWEENAPGDCPTPFGDVESLLDVADRFFAEIL